MLKCSPHGTQAQSCDESAKCISQICHSYLVTPTLPSRARSRASPTRHLVSLRSMLYLYRKRLPTQANSTPQAPVQAPHLPSRHPTPTPATDAYNSPSTSVTPLVPQHQRIQGFGWAAVHASGTRLPAAPVLQRPPSHRSRLQTPSLTTPMGFTTDEDFRPASPPAAADGSMPNAQQPPVNRRGLVASATTSSRSLRGAHQ